jgi:hypothetical protein
MALNDPQWSEIVWNCLEESQIAKAKTPYNSPNQSEKAQIDTKRPKMDLDSPYQWHKMRKRQFYKSLKRPKTVRNVH